MFDTVAARTLKIVTRSKALLETAGVNRQCSYMATAKECRVEMLVQGANIIKRDISTVIFMKRML